MTNRHECTSEDPWGPSKGSAVHPEAREVDQQSGWPCGDIVVFECPNCGLRFKEELPQ